LKKRNAKEQIKINKQLANIEEIQKLIDYFKLNKNNFPSDYTNVLSFGGFSDYYLKRLFEAKILELSIVIIQNYLEVNKFNFSFNKLKKLRNILNKLLKIYGCSQEKAVKKIRKVIECSGIEGREV
jgi:hypothetical protein